MQRRLEPGRSGQKLRGLDIGCGQGWYACEMTRAGHEMWAIDESEGQLAAARDYAAKQGVSLEFQAANASKLPFPDAHFDFAYAVNVIHHITDEELRKRVLSEIVRVLKPDGTFFLHEINTTNPFFRFYMGYLFPLIRNIDEGTERWIRPAQLPAVAGARWMPKIEYFTFLPDFVPESISPGLASLESRLERSGLRTWSAHYAALLVRMSEVRG
jgi:2-polyprenyl-3-methyl-5-hydroxy-6-metoxy-1,4-benzoquinol methylase